MKQRTYGFRNIGTRLFLCKTRVSFCVIFRPTNKSLRIVQNNVKGEIDLPVRKNWTSDTILFFNVDFRSSCCTYLNVEKQRHRKRWGQGHHLFGGQPVEVDDDDRATNLSFFLHQRCDLNQVKHFKQVFAAQMFRVPGRWKIVKQT